MNVHWDKAAVTVCHATCLSVIWENNNIKKKKIIWKHTNFILLLSVQYLAISKLEKKLNDLKLNFLWNKKSIKWIKYQGVKNFTRWLGPRVTIPTSHGHSHLTSTSCDHSHYTHMSDGVPPPPPEKSPHMTICICFYLVWPFPLHMHRWGSLHHPWKVTSHDHDHSHLKWAFSPCIHLACSTPRKKNISFTFCGKTPTPLIMYLLRATN